MTEGVSKKKRSNPYTPGEGLYPACLAGRTNEQRRLSDALEDIINGHSVAGHILYGPRGNGKTVLLADLRCKAKKKNVRILRLRGRPDGLAVDGAPEEDWWRRIELSFRLGPEDAHVTGGLPKWEDWRKNVRFPPDALGAAMAEKKQALLVAFDEAHATPPTVLGDLLGAAQALRDDGEPLLLALAGTPGLKAVLRENEASATFWNRGEHMPLGLLPAGAAGEILEKTGASGGLRYTPDALETSVENSDSYPYFVQLLGQAAWRRAEAGRKAVDEPVARLALADVRRTRRRYYRDRTDEIVGAGLIEPAVAAAQALAGRESGLTDEEIDTALAPFSAGPKETLALRDRLYALGLVWLDEETEHWTPGIPSLAVFVIEKLGPKTNLRPDAPKAGRASRSVSART